MNDNLVFNILKRTAILSLFVIGFIMFIFKEPKSIILGFVFGTLISMLSFKLLNNTINKAVLMTPARASRYSSLHYGLRYFIYFIVLTVSIVADYLSFPATMIGLLTVKIVIVGTAWFDYISSKK